ncbi:VWA domain-containing protein [Candidatus Korobacter versatilis]|uniref:VWA domain-containing protein n=1 Tax=Candidatus Korobacter versatilis TaxID=658062 RepID=UPI00164F9CCA|nr:VWA domain-containing protein [Candidatus Koribacter versatilis]
MIAGLVLPPQVALAQSQSQSGQQQQPEVPEAGGPAGDTGPMAIPKKTEKPVPPPPPRPKTPSSDSPSYSISVDVPLVNIDVSANTKDGGFIPGLKKENFRIYEDGVEQKITNFAQTEAPITAVLLVEFANGSYAFMNDALVASYNFAANLKKDDWVAVTEFDMRTHILVDFTQDKRQIYGALNTLRIPGFSEVNVFDALYDTLDRLDRVEGRKEIVLVSSGRDTFSRINLDQILKKVKATPNVTIFSISTGAAFLIWAEAHGMGSMRELDYLQADNEMNEYAKLTGGQHYKPRFEGEFPDIFKDIAARVRNQYTISYHPVNHKQDGSYRKVKVELVAGDGSGKPLIVKNEKGKELKTVLAYREGYSAKHQVE